MRSTEYGRAAVARIAELIVDPELMLDYERPKPCSYTAAAGLDPEQGLWHKAEAKVRLTKELTLELAKTKYINVARMLADRCTLDVLELVELGDTDHPTDDYLSLLDGAVKLGRTSGHIEFSKDALLEIKGVGGGCVEITLTMHLRVVWPHTSDCATHNAPAETPGPCDCMAA